MIQNGADADLAEEIAVTAVNDSRLYRWAKSIMINYARRRVKGEYNRELAIKGFVPVAEAGVKEIRQYGYIPPVSMATKRLAAAEILDYYEDEIREMTRKMQGVKDTGKPWQRRNAEGKEWYSAAKKGRTHAKMSHDEEMWRYYRKVLKQGYIESATGRKPLTDNDIAYYHIRMAECEKEIKKARPQAKRSRKKPAAGFGSIRIGRIW